MNKASLKIILIIILNTHIPNIKAQTTVAPNVTLSTYMEMFYQYDFNSPTNNQRPSFVYDYTRHNELNPHLILGKIEVLDSNFRANIGLGIGTYMDVNYANEPTAFKNIFEANIGIKLSRSSNIWLDAGILPSHIGMESGIGKLNYNLTRSLMADNSPFYETGVKISYTSRSTKLLCNAYWLTGWQRIKRIDGNSTPAFGTQIVYTPNNKISFNSSSFIGSEFPDTIQRWRIFHDFFTSFTISPILSGMAAFDIGWQQQAKGSNQYDVWTGASLIIKAQTSPKTSVAGRAEYYNDKKNVIITTQKPSTIFAYSINADYEIYKKIIARVEGRCFYASETIFSKGEANSNEDFFVSVALLISL